MTTPSTSAQWKLVPVEPTQAMNNAGSYCQLNENGLADEIYAAMIAASPSPAASPASPSGVLDLYREAVRIDVKMEGPLYMGCNTSALKRAWEADRASLASDATPAPTSGSEDGGKERIFDENGIDMTAVERALADAHVGGVSVTFNDVWAIIGSYQSAALAKPASEPAGGDVDFPMGAIENGRAFADRLEVTGLECEAGKLSMCSDWQEFRRCFDWLAQWALERAALYAHPAPATVEMLPAIAALLRVTIQSFDNGGESMRSLRALAVETAWHLIHGDDPRFEAANRECDADQWAYVRKMRLLDRAALAPATEGRKS